MNWYLYSNLLRSYIKIQSRQWNVQDTAVKKTICINCLWASGAATEETMLQTGVYYEAAPAVTVQDEKSAAPFTTIFG